MGVEQRDGKRGRPRKDEARKSSGVLGRSYWTEDVQVFFNDGWAWGTELVEKEPRPPAIRCWECWPICLGREQDILPILKGTRPSLEV